MSGIALREAFAGTSGTFVIGGNKVLFVPTESKVAYEFQHRFEAGERTYFAVPEHEELTLVAGEDSFTLEDSTLIYQGDEYTFNSSFRTPEDVIPFHNFSN